MEQQQQQQGHQQHDSFLDPLQHEDILACFAGADAYMEQHAPPQQLRSAPASGTRRKRADAGVPRGPRRMPGTGDRHQQHMQFDDDGGAANMAADGDAASMAAAQPVTGQPGQQLHPPSVWASLAQTLEETEQLLQAYAANNAAQYSAEAPGSEWRLRKESWFKQHREAAPACASILLTQHAAPPGESKCSLCQKSCSCTIR